METRKYEDFVQVLFTVKYQSVWERIKEKGDLFWAGVRFLEEVVERYNNTIPIPKDFLKAMMKGREEEIDCFKYLEEVMRRLIKKGKPVFVLDEVQMLREVDKNGPVIHDLFNFLVRITKETHLCHCLCATSDCLFIKDVFSNARLEGRAKYILVDDLQKDEAFKVYEEFGFEDKDLVWEYIEGKFGDMISLYEDIKRGYSEGKALEGMLKNELSRLEWIRWKQLKNMKDGEDTWKFLKNFKENEGLINVKIVENFDNLLFWIEENVLFYNPV